MKFIYSLLLTFSLTVLSGPVDKFFERFELVKDEQGKLMHIKARGVVSQFNLNKYFLNLKEDLEALSKDLFPQGGNSLSDTEAERKIDSLLEEIGLVEDTSAFAPNHDPFAGLFKKRDRRNIRKSLKRSFQGLKTLSLKDAIDKLDKKGIIENFIKKLNGFYENLDLSIVAQPNKPKFYYKKKIANEVFRQAMRFAKRKMNSVPYLDLASFIFTEAEKKIIEQRVISQNILLYYLSNFESELGLTADEVNRVVSSIYESRIAVNGWLESRSAVKTWSDFGWNKFDTILRSAQGKHRSLKKTMKDLSHLDYIFYNGFNAKGQRVIYNFSVNEHMYTSRPAVSFYYDKPRKVRNIRTMIKMGQMALGFVPKIPAFIKSQVHSFASSYYVQQSLNDAFLYAYFESREDSEEKKQIKEQISNPYIVL